jgi:hypothetical protein
MRSLFLFFFQNALVSRAMRQLPIRIERYLALRKRNAYMVGIGIAIDAIFDRADALCRTFRDGHVHLDQHSITRFPVIVALAHRSAQDAGEWNFKLHTTQGPRKFCSSTGLRYSGRPMFHRNESD